MSGGTNCSTRIIHSVSVVHESSTLMRASYMAHYTHVGALAVVLLGVSALAPRTLQGQAPLEELRALAAEGDAQAQFFLGRRYAGFGVDFAQNGAEAVQWYRLAADQGHTGAQLNLGLMYVNGRAIPQDKAEAERWYFAAGRGYQDAQFIRVAADHGVANAQYTLGVMYATGRSVQQDDEEAVRWYRRAADQGHAVAQLSLGLMYGTGRGIPQDDVEAHMWFNLAATQQPGEDLDQAVKNRDIVAGLMTPDQTAEAQRRAREWSAAHPRQP